MLRGEGGFTLPPPVRLEGCCPFTALTLRGCKKQVLELSFSSEQTKDTQQLLGRNGIHVKELGRLLPLGNRS